MRPTTTIRSLAVLLAAAISSSAAAEHPQAPLLSPTTPSTPPATDVDSRRPIKQVAIIGAGAAGSSAAYYLRRYAAAADAPVNITIFDRNAYIGGRSTTVYAYDDPTTSTPALELGASIFVSVNYNLVNATREFNLSTTQFLAADDDEDTPDLGVYDGHGMVLVQRGDSYWDLAKLVWQYGLAPWRTLKLMRATVERFLRMYEAPVFPFPALDEAVEMVGLEGTVGVTGAQLLEANGIGGSFGHDVVQASTRVNYAIDLDRIHGLEAMVCMATDGAMSIHGGNWRIFDGMVRASGAVRALETEVRRVARTDDGRLDVHAAPLAGVDSDDWVGTFDDIVLAAPMQYAGIEWVGDVLEHVPEPIPYVDLHVTLLASRHKLDPGAFGLARDQIVPRAVLTTTPAEPESVGPDFFSISLLDKATNPKTGEREFIYKFFTADPANSTLIGRVLGLGELDEEAEISQDDVSWTYRKLWQSYPVELPRVTFEKIRIGRGVLYTSGIESFISTMETSSLMGMNVARLIVDGWEQNATVEVEDMTTH